MAWTAPRTWAADEVVTAALMNTHIRDNISYLIGQFPQRATMWHEEATVTVGNPIVATVSTGMLYNGLWVQTAAADGDTFTNTCMLDSGTYTLYVLGNTRNVCGMVDWYVNNVLEGSGQDWYSAASSPNVVKTVGSIVIATPGRYVVKGVVNGKNGSSTDYQLRLVKYWLKQATDT